MTPGCECSANGEILATSISMKIKDLVWFAGILDGEGYISVDRTHKGRDTFVASVVVGMKGREVPFQLYTWFGGNLHQAKRGEWRWSVMANRALPILQMVLPYLRLKKGVAVTVLSFLLQRKNNGGANTPLEYVERQIRFHKQAKQLNEATYS